MTNKAVEIDEEASGSGEANGIQVIGRAAAILRALELEDSGLSLGEIAQRVGLPRSTVQRIVAALSAEGLVLASGRRGEIRLGPALLALACSVDVASERQVRPVLVELSREIGETVDLSVLQGNRAIFIDQVAGTRRLIAVSAVGERFPLHCTANGKALLGCLSTSRRSTLLRGTLEKLTPHTIVDTSEIERQLLEFGQTQLSWDREEHAEGISAVGTAMIDALGRSYAISIPMPAGRFEPQAKALGEILLAYRQRCLDILPGSHKPAGV